MAHPVLVVVPPREDAVDPEEEGVQPPRPEHGSVPELVAGVVQVRGHGAVREEREDESDPALFEEAVDGQCPGGGGERKVTRGLNPSLEVASLGQLAERLALDGTAVPLDPAGIDVSGRSRAGARAHFGLTSCTPSPGHAGSWGFLRFRASRRPSIVYLSMHVRAGRWRAVIRRNNPSYTGSDIRFEPRGAPRARRRSGRGGVTGPCDR